MSALHRAKEWTGFPRDAVFALLFAFAVAFSLWKCPFGFGSYDDAFYLTIPHRLSMGDVLFADEWHVSQMAGLLTLPPVWLYRTLTGSTDGILLAARYAFVVVHALASLFFYLRTRTYGVGAMAAALSWFLFTPYDIMALSYNTMALDFILLSGVLLAAVERRWCWALSGVCLAAAVLCCPYFAVAWFLYAAGVGAFALWMRRRPADGGRGGILAPSRLLWLTAGTAAAAALFLLYILTTCGLQGVLDNLPYILSDPEHQGMSPLVKLQNAWYGLVHCHPLFQFVLIGFLLLLPALLLDKRRKSRRTLYLTASCVLALASYALFCPGAVNTYYHAIMFPMLFVGLTAFLLCENPPWGLFATLFLGGVVYAAAVTLGSNNFFYAISMACALTNAASLLFLGQLLAELRASSSQAVGSGLMLRCAAGAAALTVSVLLLLQVHVKANHCFMDDPPSALTCQLQNGPGRGIRTTEYRAGVYERLNGELQVYKTLPQGKLLILNERSWCCLAADPMEYATFSGWISGENQAALDRLASYYQLNPGKAPDYIFLSKSSLFEDPNAILEAAQAQGYILTESEFSYYLSRQ